VIHLGCKPFLFFQRAAQTLLAFVEIESGADKSGKFRQGSRVPGIEMAALVGNDPERAERFCTTDINRHQQNLGYGDAYLGDPAIGSFRMSSENRAVLFQCNPAWTGATRRGTAFQRG